MKRNQVLWLGAVVGGLVGLGVAYLLAPEPEPAKPGAQKEPFIAKLGPGDALAIGQTLWALLRRIQRVRGRRAEAW